MEPTLADMKTLASATKEALLAYLTNITDARQFTGIYEIVEELEFWEDRLLAGDMTVGGALVFLETEGDALNKWEAAARHVSVGAVDEIGGRVFKVTSSSLKFLDGLIFKYTGENKLDPLIVFSASMDQIFSDFVDQRLNAAIDWTAERAWVTHALGTGSEWPEATYNLIDHVAAGRILKQNYEANLATLTIDDSQATAAEGSTAIFRVNLDKAATETVTFDVTTYRIDINGDILGYSNNSSFSIPAGSDSVQIPVTHLTDDLHGEGIETYELRVSNIQGAKIPSPISTPYISAFGAVIDSTPEPSPEPNFTLANFEVDVDRYLEDARAPRVNYTISHDGDETLSNVVVRFYKTDNGQIDGNETLLDHESAGTLYAEETDQEGENIHALLGETGQFTLVTTVSYDGSDGEQVLRTDRIDLQNGPVQAPDMESIDIDNQFGVTANNSLRIEYALDNDSGTTFTGAQVKFYASDSVSFDRDDATYLDRESAGTLYDGERDTEGETIARAADLEAGRWFLHSVFTHDGDSDGVVLSSDEFVVSSASSTAANLIIEDFRADDSVLDHGQDLYVRQTASNIGTATARDVVTTYFWSADDQFDFRDDLIVDTDGHGTLYAGERDTNEYERIDNEDLPRGFGYIFGVIDYENQIDEGGLVNEIDNVSDPWAILVA